MSVDKYRLVSPGVFIDEIDNSQLPNESVGLGPVIIGRTERGPSMRPVQVNSFSDFIEVFGNPIPGGLGGDLWRDGNYSAPTYAAYAAQAWLKNNTPVTMVRLLGVEHDDATSAGKAGWKIANAPSTTLNINGGAFGLFVGDKNAVSTTNQGNAVLAAVWYLNEGSIRLVGDAQADSVAIEGAAAAILSTGPNYEFKAVIENKSGTAVLTSSFNFNRNSVKFARNVFNTNPTLVNADITQDGTGEYGQDSGTPATNNLTTYWLGETFESFVGSTLTGSTGAASQYGIILPLIRTGTGAFEGADYQISSRAAKTGWVISQDLSDNTGSFEPGNMTKLFRFICTDSGEWEQKNLKVSITEIKASTNTADPYGAFSVEIRKASDTDNAPVILEKFSGLNLNPASANYIARKIGDTYQIWDEVERRYRTYGNYLNASKFVRLEMNPDVDAGTTDARLLPFGFFGPPKFNSYSFTSGSIAITAPIRGRTLTVVHTQRMGTGDIDIGSGDSCTFVFPDITMRASSSEGNLPLARMAYWGLTTNIAGTTRFDEAYTDLTRPKPDSLESYTPDTDAGTTSTVFSLDDLKWVDSSSVNAQYVSGSRAAGTSITAGQYWNTNTSTDALRKSNPSASYAYVLDAEFNKFTMPLFGGFDGLDITEKEPFRNEAMVNGTETTNYAFNTIKRAIDIVSDAEVVEYNLMTAPGVTNENLTTHMIRVCEDRGDALAIVDLAGGFVPSTENAKGDAHPDNRGSVATTITNLKNRGLNTSYGCAYYPWVQVKDTIAGNLLWVPPSVVVLGTMGSSETKSELWFAPAGFTRGGLSEGSAGLPVINVRERLNSNDRDKLYTANINPIATFPAEGIVVFGQKTLQITPSALDRINVRRLLIYVKKEISRMAATTLFEPNVERTWSRFRSAAVPFLESVQSRLGLSDFKLVLDKTTTTADLVDRNIMYAKIFLKPTRAIEFIALDFSISNTGAGFED